MPILDHRTRTVVAWGLGPSPSAELALGVWAEAKSLGELKGVVEGRLRYSHEGRLPSGLGYRTPKEVMGEALGQSPKGITQGAG